MLTTHHAALFASILLALSGSAKEDVSARARAASGGLAVLPPMLLRDADGDGVRDDVDPCPSDREDFDGVADYDGCPDRDADNRPTRIEGVEGHTDERGAHALVLGITGRPARAVAHRSVERGSAT